MATICFLALLACKSIINRMIVMKMKMRMVKVMMMTMVRMVVKMMMVKMMMVKMVMVKMLMPTSSLGSPGRLYGMRRSTERIRGRNLERFKLYQSTRSF